MSKETCDITYSGMKLGKTKTTVSLMFLEYIKNHLGKDIKVSFHDIELLDQKNARIKELEEELEKVAEDFNFNSKQSLKYRQRIKELENLWNHIGLNSIKIEEAENQLKEANEILVGFSGRDGYEKVNQYFAKYRGE